MSAFLGAELRGDVAQPVIGITADHLKEVWVTDRPVTAKSEVPSDSNAKVPPGGQ